MGIFAIIGSVYAAAGLVDHAIDLTQTTLDNIEATGLMSVFGPSVLGALARLRLLKHNVPAAEAQIRRARQIVKPGFTLENFLGGEQVWLAEAELILARQDYALAVETLDALLAGLHAWGISRSGLEALYLKGKACLALGRLDDARAAFESARTQAEAAPARILLWQILAALSQIEAQRGRRVEAQSLRVQARQVITFIADHAPPELRASFLELPDVRAVMNET
jgi:tetratricopeptide (TPR) repeat protein